MIFPTRVNGIPCQCEVINHVPAPAEDSGIEYRILDQQGKPAPWLERKLTEQDETLIVEDYHILRQAHAYNYH